MEKKQYIICALSALAAGCINGIFGTGGGIVLVAVQSKLFKGDVKSAIASTLVCTLCMSVATAVIYLLKGNVSFSDAAPYLLPSVAGGVAGSAIFKKISPVWLCRIFSVFVIIAGARAVIA